MEFYDLPLRLILSFILGAVIGLEREINEKKDLPHDLSKKPVALLGLRSFSMIAGLGTFTGILFSLNPLLLFLPALVFGSLVVAFYILDSKNTQDFGITTELAILYAYLIGFLLTIPQIPIQLLLAVTIVLVLLMSRKEKIKDVVEDIRRSELNAFIGYAILAFVILPFLPNITYSISDIPNAENFFSNIGWNIEKFSQLELFNPFKIWLIVVLITGVDVAGYILERTIGKQKGWLVTSIAGGFVSSTATTVSLAKQSIKGNRNLLLSAALFANLVSFIPVIFLLGAFNPLLLVRSFLVISTIIMSFAIAGGYFLYKSGNESKKSVDANKTSSRHEIFNLLTALKFVGLFLTVNITSKIALEYFGNTGFLLTSAIGALPGIDAVIINIAQLAGGRVDYNLAVWALILVNCVNLLAKSAYSFLQGEKRFAFKFLICITFIIGLSILINIIF